MTVTSYPAVIGPDATDVCVSFLRDALDGQGDDATVAARIPNLRPERLVVVRRVGGPRLNLVADDPMISVECWAADTADAHDLAQLCRALVHTMRGGTVAGVPIYRIDELAGPADLPDPLSDQPRYVFTVQIAMRGTALPPASAPIGGS